MARTLHKARITFREPQLHPMDSSKTIQVIEHEYYPEDQIKISSDAAYLVGDGTRVFSYPVSVVASFVAWAVKDDDE